MKQRRPLPWALPIGVVLAVALGALAADWLTRAS